MTLADDVFLGDAFALDAFDPVDALEVTRDDGDGDRDESGDERNRFDDVMLFVGVIVDADDVIDVFEVVVDDDEDVCRRGGGDDDGGVGGLAFDS